MVDRRYRLRAAAFVEMARRLEGGGDGHDGEDADLESAACWAIFRLGTLMTVTGSWQRRHERMSE